MLKQNKLKTMINANELRLGDIVSYNGIIGNVTWIQQNCITIEYPRRDDLSNGSIVSPELLDGVVITDDIAIKCGFRRQVSGIGWNKYSNGIVDLSLAPLSNGSYVPVYHVNGEMVQIKYLHQLQNLFWCLVEKELDTTKLFD